LYFGNSGAGFGALHCAIKSERSMGVGTNPLLELFHFAPFKFGHDAAELFRPGSDLAGLSTEFPTRFSVISALEFALKSGKQPRLGLIQNILDQDHYESHYCKFCRTFGLPVEGGSSNSRLLHSAVYEHSAGHASRPRPTLIKDLITRLWGK
jgi:hypothetical protein